MADRKGINFFDTYIPTAEEAAADPNYTGVYRARPIDEEFGGADRDRAITGLDLEFGGVGDKIRRLGGMAVPRESYDLGF